MSRDRYVIYEVELENSNKILEFLLEIGCNQFTFRKDGISEDIFSTYFLEKKMVEFYVIYNPKSKNDFSEKAPIYNYTSESKDLLHRSLTTGLTEDPFESKFKNIDYCFYRDDLLILGVSSCDENGCFYLKNLSDSEQSSLYNLLKKSDIKFSEFNPV